MDSRSRFLFARPSFSDGIARLMDFGGLLNAYNLSPSAETADQCALAMDFAVVRDELARAVGEMTTAE